MQCWSSVEYVGPTLYKCYTNALFAGHALKFEDELSFRNLVHALILEHNKKFKRNDMHLYSNMTWSWENYRNIYEIN